MSPARPTPAHRCDRHREHLVQVAGCLRDLAYGALGPPCAAWEHPRARRHQRADPVFEAAWRRILARQRWEHPRARRLPVLVAYNPLTRCDARWRIITDRARAGAGLPVSPR